MALKGNLCISGSGGKEIPFDPERLEKDVLEISSHPGRKMPVMQGKKYLNALRRKPPAWWPKPWALKSDRSSNLRSENSVPA